MKYIHSFFCDFKTRPPCYGDTIVRLPVAPKCVTVKQTEGALWEVICMPELFSTLRSLRSCLHSRITASAAHICTSCSAPALSTRPSLCDTGLQRSSCYRYLTWDSGSGLYAHLRSPTLIVLSLPCTNPPRSHETRFVNPLINYINPFGLSLLPFFHLVYKIKNHS